MTLNCIPKIKNSREKILDQWEKHLDVDRKRKFFKTERNELITQHLNFSACADQKILV